MRKFTYLSLLVATVIILASSCHKQYNEDLVGTGSGNEFTWNGNPPFSAILNGKAFVATSIYIAPDSQKPSQVAFIVQASDSNGNVMGVTVLGAANPGDIFDIPYPANVTYVINGTPGNVLQPTSGKMKILENSSSYVSGMFYVNLTTNGTNVSQTDTAVVVTQGYFRVKKP